MSDRIIDLGTVFKGSESGRAIKKQGASLKLQPDDVVIDILYSGLCGTDLHYCHKDMVLGHEGVGVISQVGTLVKNVKVGDRVGWAYNHYGCNYCDYCLEGLDVHCPERRFYGEADLDIGSFGDKAILNSKFVHLIPDNIPSRLAGPLQCAGSTVFTAMVNAGVKPYDRVGIVGLGGLGHLAVQFCTKAGCDVVVFSSTDAKKSEAMQLGAKEFVATKGNPKLQGIEPVNALFVTAGSQPDWDALFGIVAPEGAIVPLTVSPTEMKHPYMEMLIKQLKLIGTVAGSRSVHREMLKFASKHGIEPIIEELPMTEDGLNEALNRLAKGDVRYRFVLKSQTNSEA